ncbi:hypothetical protein OTK49_21595 [Vibrio coralliirubri]|uniref:2OG-Fe(II) oxygenase family protein n=1 Tax=Vibrio coralliirubri TaxID=1516159 RepID=UPI0022835C8A|nr:2OG-Fe(II) oxygenase family protein [Vibrio coralliirubri]MCY9865117.1 hypothetical protein [Vibrio coralliirubri]
MIAFNRASGISNIFAQNGYAVVGFHHDGLSELLDATNAMGAELAQPIFSALVDFDSSPIAAFLSYYYNEDNQKVVAFMSSSPNLNKVSVGSVYFCFNSTEQYLPFASLNGETITVAPNNVLFVNIGLVGIGFDILQTNGLLQGVIHSSIDTLSYSPVESCAASLPRIDIELHSDVLKGHFDIKTFMEHGYATSTISKELADQLLTSVKAEHFISVEQNALDEYCDYSKRYISKHSMFKPTQIKHPFSVMLGEINQFLKPLMERYPNPKGDNVSVFAASKGHFMDLHADNADGSPIICIIYLADEIFTPEDGGQISSSRCFMNEDTHKLERQNLDAMVSPNHGIVAYVNNSSAKFGHEVHEILSEKYRYSIIHNFAMLTNPDWNHEFDERSGEFEENTLALEEPK